MLAALEKLWAETASELNLTCAITTQTSPQDASTVDGAIEIDDQKEVVLIEIHLKPIEGPIVSLFDTGSPMHLIRDLLVPAEIPRHPVEPRALGELSGYWRDVTSIVTLYLEELHEWVCFYVVPELPHAVIVGADIVSRFLTLPPELKPVRRAPASEVASVVAFIEYEEEHKALYPKADPVSSDFHQLAYIRRWTEEFFNKFGKTINDDPPLHAAELNGFYHAINLKPGRLPARRARYRVLQAKAAEIASQVQGYLDVGFIVPSKSEFALPIVLVGKKDGTGRMCVDYRQLNDCTIKDLFPLPLMDDLLQAVGNCQYFSSLDLTQGYHQIAVKPEDRHKTAFVTSAGLFEWKVMPFGLCNAPATFQRVMNGILQPFLNKFVLVYLDDILIYSRSEEEHGRHVHQVFEVLQKHRLIAKKKKCSFFRKKLVFLGHTIANNSITPADDKLRAIKEWPVPTTVKEVQSFVGFAGFYRKFVKNFLAIARPLYRFACGDEKWGLAQATAFDSLRAALLKSPVLIPPQAELPYVVTTDASDYALGAVIEQVKGSKVLGVVAYFSLQFKGAELNYPVREKEMLAVVRTLEKFRYLLQGQKVTIRTDHESLIHLLKSAKEPHRRMIRWLDFLAEFDLEIEYIKGATNRADALSRVHAICTTVATNFSLGTDFGQEIKDAYAADEFFQQVYAVLVGNLPRPKLMAQFCKKFYLQDGLLYMAHNWTNTAPRLCIPTFALQKRVVEGYHSSDWSKHPGIHATLLAVSEHFYWNNMHLTVKRLIGACLVCQTSKPSNHLTYGLLQPMPIPEGRWTLVSMDFLSISPPSEGFDSIFVIVDRFTKRAHMVANHKEDTAQTVARLFIENVVRLHGMPSSIVSDRDSRFTSTFWRELMSALGTELKLSTPHHAQTDGQTERVNRSIIQLLRVTTKDHAEWSRWLPMIEFAYNNHTHSSTGMTPFYADLGQDVVPPDIDSRVAYSVASARIPRTALIGSDLATELKAIQIRVRDALVFAQRRQERNHNRRRQVLELQVGDQVLVHRDANVYGSTFPKLRPLYFGPYYVSKVESDNVVELDLGMSPAYSRRHNVKHLKKFNEDELLSLMYSTPPRTQRELCAWARRGHIVCLEGIDRLTGFVALRFRGCLPSHAGFYLIDDYEKAIDPHMRAQLEADYQAAMASKAQELTADEDSLVELDPEDA